jgi:hypothetical protein
MKMFIRFLSLFIAAFIALPSTAEAWHYSLLLGWEFDSYAECMDYYAANPPGDTWVGGGLGHSHKEHFTSGQLCAHMKDADDEERRNQEQITAIILLNCREHSVTYRELADCVAGSQAYRHLLNF